MTTADTYAVIDLLHENRSYQFEVLEAAIVALSQGRHVRSLYVRGSIAQSSADRLSDVDLVVVVDDDAFVDHVRNSDRVVKSFSTPLFAGWSDRLAPNFGGHGLVYLLRGPHGVYQLDLYYLPASKVGAFLERHDEQHVFEARRVYLDSSFREDFRDASATSTAEVPHSTATPASSVAEAFVLSFLMKKRVERGEYLASVHELTLVKEATRDHLRRELFPNTTHTDWYKLDVDLSGTAKLRDLRERMLRLADTPSCRNLDDVRAFVGEWVDVFSIVSAGALGEVAVAADHVLEAGFGFSAQKSAELLESW